MHSQGRKYDLNVDVVVVHVLEAHARIVAGAVDVRLLAINLSQSRVSAHARIVLAPDLDAERAVLVLNPARGTIAKFRVDIVGPDRYRFENVSVEVDMLRHYCLLV